MNFMGNFLTESEGDIRRDGGHDEALDQQEY